MQLGTVNPTQSGSDSWIDLSDGQQVELAPGAQGGFHVWLLYRVGGNTQEQQVRVDRIADRIAPDNTTERVLTASGVQDLPAQPLWQLPMPQPSFMCPTPIGVSVLDAPVQLDVRLSSDLATGMSPGSLLAEQHVLLHLSCPPAGDPQHDFCLKICQG